MARGTCTDIRDSGRVMIAFSVRVLFRVVTKLHTVIILSGWLGDRRPDLSMIAEAFRQSSVRRLLAYDKEAVEKVKMG
jgi:hypothetical protein